VYILSGAAYPTSPLFVGYVWGVGQLIGSPLVIAGVLLIYKGWKEIVFKKGTVLVTDGIYSVVRHPQYLGFLLVTLGQFIVWPTIPTAILWPLLAVLYYRQAKREDAALSVEFGERFSVYAKKTPMFVPKIRIPRGPKPVSP
jgi:protein-S-isoprenylcysteine O-methyltransferase Ste14